MQSPLSKLSLFAFASGQGIDAMCLPVAKELMVSLPLLNEAESCLFCMEIVLPKAEAAIRSTVITCSRFLMVSLLRGRLHFPLLWSCLPKRCTISVYGQLVERFNSKAVGYRLKENDGSVGDDVPGAQCSEIGKGWSARSP